MEVFQFNQLNGTKGKQAWDLHDKVLLAFWRGWWLLWDAAGIFFPMSSRANASWVQGGLTAGQG